MGLSFTISVYDLGRFYESNQRQQLVLMYISFKILKGYSKFVNQRRTDNTMAKAKRAKGQTTINKTYI